MECVPSKIQGRATLDQAAFLPHEIAKNLTSGFFAQYLLCPKQAIRAEVIATEAELTPKESVRE